MSKYYVPARADINNGIVTKSVAGDASKKAESQKRH
jgi:hypothetical protein